MKSGLTIEDKSMESIASSNRASAIRVYLPSISKEYMCKHIVGLAALIKWFRIPDAAETDLLGTKHKPG